MKNLLILISMAFLTGCVASKHYVIVATGTTLGIEIAQNPASQMYQAKLGYNRAELALVPSNRASDPSSVSTGEGAKDTTDVVMELHLNNILSVSGSGVYQRLAVGSAAVAQPGAAFMFAKGPDGKLDAGVASQIASNIRGLPSPSSTATALKVPLAKAFQTAADKSKFEAAAKANGYASFGEFLTDSGTTVDKISAVAKSIQDAK